MSAVLKPLTKMVEFEQRDVLLRDLEILPESLQTRATTDMGVVRVYSEAMASGSVFPPPVVFRTEEGRLLLADGFHRVEARKRLGFKNVRSVIRDGSIEEAILFGIDANFSADNIREVTHNDRRHAVKLMLRNKSFTVWPDKQIALRCSVSRTVVASIRSELFDSEGIAIPERVVRFIDGKPSESFYAYGKGLSRMNGRPVITETHRYNHQKDFPAFHATIDGKRVHLGTDRELAKEKLDEFLAQRSGACAVIKEVGNFRQWLSVRGLHISGPSERGFGGIFVSGSLLLRCPDVDFDSVLREIGRASLWRNSCGFTGRIILIGYFGSNKGLTGSAIAAAKEPPLSLEFMGLESLPESLLGSAPSPAAPPAIT